MAIHKYMSQDLDDMVEDLELIAKDLNCSRSPCCSLDRFRLWDNEEEARFHRRIIAVQRKIKEISRDISKVSPQNAE
jgi:hypothetical protein